jgi:hypothetical protein
MAVLRFCALSAAAPTPRSLRAQEAGHPPQVDSGRADSADTKRRDFRRRPGECVPQADARGHSSAIRYAGDTLAREEAAYRDQVGDRTTSLNRATMDL